MGAAASTNTNEVATSVTVGGGGLSRSSRSGSMSASSGNLNTAAKVAAKVGILSSLKSPAQKYALCFSFRSLG